jgi:hypothetical protein
LLQALGGLISEALEEFDDESEEIDLDNLAIEIAPVANSSKWEEPSAPGYYPQHNQAHAHAHAQPVNDLTMAIAQQTGLWVDLFEYLSNRTSYLTESNFILDYEYDDEGYEGGMATAPVLPPIDMTPMAAAIPHHDRSVQAVPVESYGDEWADVQGYGGRLVCCY